MKSEKHSLKKVKTLQMSETLRLVEPLKEAKLELGESPELPDACVLAKTTEGTKAELDRQGRSLLRQPRMAVKSVSTLMVSALQSGWQMRSWKVSTIPLFPKTGLPIIGEFCLSSQMRTQPPVETPEAEMLCKVYLVLWAIRKQLRQPHPMPCYPTTQAGSDPLAPAAVLSNPTGKVFSVDYRACPRLSEGGLTGNCRLPEVAHYPASLALKSLLVESCASADAQGGFERCIHL
ncbi:hypothetical protein P7K49_004090 [Saguinus oedipus]|uniref:Uncharacterized protein n=1 Tax=Saguinus oedipus TaxID=9490 RepID=A0ABQ9W807_SAGOE|nr:hypothetical protein P7K49_004090 [Saguinus oedipus]